MRTKGKKKQNKFVKYILAPFKVLGKAREFYMKSMFDCAQQVGQAGNVMPCTIPYQIPNKLPKNFSNVSMKNGNDDENSKRLHRVVSTKNVKAMVEINMNIRRELKKQITDQSTLRSYSTGVGRLGRIDENKPCDFKELDVNKVVYPRLRSYALVSRDRLRI